MRELAPPAARQRTESQPAGDPRAGDLRSRDLADVERLVTETAAAHSYEVRAIQGNHEGLLLDTIHESRLDCAGIVINPGGLTHTSVVLRDALSGVGLPVAEVHISDVMQREPFRHHSYVADVAIVHVIGEGVAGYRTATERLIAAIEGA